MPHRDQGTSFEVISNESLGAEQDTKNKMAKDHIFGPQLPPLWISNSSDKIMACV